MFSFFFLSLYFDHFTFAFVELFIRYPKKKESDLLSIVGNAILMCGLKRWNEIAAHFNIQIQMKSQVITCAFVDLKSGCLRNL